jgi:2,3-bisphosphoglycerate-dependent phosphoglycerate mutase
VETTIYLLRHAQSHPKASLPHAEWPLSPVGRAQAERLPGLLRPLGIEVVHSSPFLRCRETLGPYVRATGLDVQIADGLRERLIAKNFVDGFYELWRRSWEDYQYALPGCENSADAQERMCRTVDAIVRKEAGRTICLSSHGNVIGLFLNSVDPTAGQEEAEALTNPDIVRIYERGGEYRWDRGFRVGGIDEIATPARETPVEE